MADIESLDTHREWCRLRRGKSCHKKMHFQIITILIIIIIIIMIIIIIIKRQFIMRSNMARFTTRAPEWHQNLHLS